MTNEKVEGEATSSEETSVSKEQTTPEEVTDSNVVTDSEVENKEVNPETQEKENATDKGGDEADKGDLRVPLKEERTKRQELEAQLDDPEFIAQKAREIGIIQDNVQNEAQPQQGQDTGYSQYKYFSELDKAQEKYPQLKKNEALQYSVTAYINKGMSPLKAADKVFSEIQKESEELAKQKIDETKKEEQERANATNVTSTSTDTKESSEYEQLIRDSKSLDRKKQDKAMIKLLEIKAEKKSK